jgi:hypothetical protein
MLPSPVEKRSFMPEAYVAFAVRKDRFSTPSHTLRRSETNLSLFAQGKKSDSERFQYQSSPGQFLSNREHRFATLLIKGAGLRIPKSK